MLFHSARNRALKKGLPFDLVPEDIIIPDVCPITKQSFVRCTKYGASIDKIDPTKGYVKGNIIVVSKTANMAKGENNAAEIVALARNLIAYYEKHT